MAKKIFFVLCMLLSLPCFKVWAGNEESKPVEIIKGDMENKDKYRPRTLVGVPITCTYSEGTLYFTFYEDLGELEITVTNLSSGAASIDECDSTTGSAIVGASSDSGSYRVEIVAEDGTYYYGEYVL